jgi:hypothetical protein
MQAPQNARLSSCAPAVVDDSASIYFVKAALDSLRICGSEVVSNGMGIELDGHGRAG